MQRKPRRTQGQAAATQDLQRRPRRIKGSRPQREDLAKPSTTRLHPTKLSAQTAPHLRGRRLRQPRTCSEDLAASRDDGTEWDTCYHLAPPVNTCHPNHHPVTSANGQQIMTCKCSCAAGEYRGPADPCYIRHVRLVICAEAGACSIAKPMFIKRYPGTAGTQLRCAAYHRISHQTRRASAGTQTGAPSHVACMYTNMTQTLQRSTLPGVSASTHQGASPHRNRIPQCIREHSNRCIVTLLMKSHE